MKIKRNFIVKILAASAFICEICTATQNFSAAKDAARFLKEDEILILKSDLAAAKKQGSALQELNLEENFYFLTGQKELWPIFKKASLMIRPTNTDGDALSIREALYFLCILTSHKANALYLSGYFL